MKKGEREITWWYMLAGLEYVRRVGIVFFFFFKQKTAYEIRNCDWSSDVCSSDLMQMRFLTFKKKWLGGSEAQQESLGGVRGPARGVKGPVRGDQKIGRASCRERV